MVGPLAPSVGARGPSASLGASLLGMGARAKLVLAFLSGSWLVSPARTIPASESGGPPAGPCPLVVHGSPYFCVHCVVTTFFLVIFEKLRN